MDIKMWYSQMGIYRFVELFEMCVPEAGEAVNSLE